MSRGKTVTTEKPMPLRLLQSQLTFGGTKIFCNKRCIKIEFFVSKYFVKYNLTRQCLNKMLRSMLVYGHKPLCMKNCYGSRTLQATGNV